VAVESRTRSGWVTLSAVLITVVGAYNVLWGIGALNKKSLFRESSLLYSNLTLWGWFFLIVGVGQVVTAVLLFQRRLVGAWMAAVGAGASAFFAAFTIVATPAWAVVIIALDVLVLWLIFSHYDDFEE
jgi:hypothetical protein